jgi:hypothetical protein
MTSERATLTSALVQRATDRLIAGFTEELAREHEREALRMGDLVRQLVVRAYQEGVRDGFVQGCDAQATSEEANRAAA